MCRPALAPVYSRMPGIIGPSRLRELITNRSSGVNYGMDRIRFINPVRVDSQVRLSGKVVRADKRDTGVRVQVELQMAIRDQDKPAMVGDFVVLALP